MTHSNMCLTILTFFMRRKGKKNVLNLFLSLIKMQKKRNDEPPFKNISQMTNNSHIKKTNIESSAFYSNL